MNAQTVSTYKFECPCGAKCQTQTIKAASICPDCGRVWSIEWDHEINKAKGR